MSKLGKLRETIEGLEDIKNILSAMKNLSIVEFNKVSRYLLLESKATENIENALTDFTSFFNLSRDMPERERLFILVGSERGLCGGFNQLVINYFESHFEATKADHFFLIGNKLLSRYSEKFLAAQNMPGPSSAEEIPFCINELGQRLMEFSHLRWVIISNSLEQDKIVATEVWPLEFSAKKTKRQFFTPPRLNLAPKVFYTQLLEHYLFSMFYKTLYLSFMAENKERLMHMEGALKKLDQQWQHLTVKANILRQEEITEEIEVILLGR